MRNKKPDPSMIDDDNPEWTDKMFRAARPARDVLPPEFFTGMTKLKRARGRPKKAQPKQHLGLRLDPDVIAWFKAGGPGYQSRINAALKEWIGRRKD